MYVPSEGNGHDSGSVLSDLEERRLGQVEVLEGRVAPAAVVVRQGVVGRAKVCGGDGDGVREAPSRVVVAPHLVACPAAQSVVEQGRAQRCGVCAVPLAVQVAVPACPSCQKTPQNHSTKLHDGDEISACHRSVLLTFCVLLCFFFPFCL